MFDRHVLLYVTVIDHSLHRGPDLVDLARLLFVARFGYSFPDLADVVQGIC